VFPNFFAMVLAVYGAIVWGMVLLSARVPTAFQLSGLFKPGNDLWNFALRIGLPIFNAGANQADLKVVQVNRDIARDIAMAQYVNLVTLYKVLGGGQSKKGGKDFLSLTEMQESFPSKNG
jgi:hypothetical protein